MATYSPAQFIRATPFLALQDYFSRRGIEAFDSFDWSGGKRAVEGSATKTFSELEPQHQEVITAEWDRVHQLSDAAGQNALLDAARDRQATIAAFESMENGHERALRMLLDDEPAFARAEFIREADNRLGGRFWSGFATQRDAVIRRDDETLRSLEAALRDHYAARDGSGRRVKVEIFDRGRQSTDGIVDLVQVTVYLEGMATSLLEFSEEGLDRRPHRPVVELAMTYAPQSGELDVMATGGKRERSDLARTVIQILIGDTDDPTPVPLRTYRLNSLRRPRDFPIDPGDAIEAVIVRRLRLRPQRSTRGQVILEIDGRAQQSLYDFADEAFGDGNPLRNGARVNQARLAIRRLPTGNQRRGKVITFDITAPNGCTLKNRTEAERRISEKYLPRWGLVEDV
ncbi:MAG: hypothetical protein RLO50_02865 [Azospirillaceae bacterium]